LLTEVNFWTTTLISFRVGSELGDIADNCFDVCDRKFLVGRELQQLPELCQTLIGHAGKRLHGWIGKDGAGAYGEDAYRVGRHISKIKRRAFCFGLFGACRRRGLAIGLVCLRRNYMAAKGLQVRRTKNRINRSVTWNTFALLIQTSAIGYKFTR
jgi:hypothetical protein